MVKKKYLIIGIISFVGIVGIFYIQNLRQYPYCYAESKEGKWIAYEYIVYTGGEWTGELFYQGNNTGDIGVINVEIDYNGETNRYKGKIKPRRNMVGDSITKDRFIKEKKAKYYDLWEFGGTDIPKATIRVSWKENGIKKHTTLKPKLCYGGPFLRKILIKYLVR